MENVNAIILKSLQKHEEEIIQNLKEMIILNTNKKDDMYQDSIQELKDIQRAIVSIFQ